MAQCQNRVAKITHLNNIGCRRRIVSMDEGHVTYHSTN